MDPYPDPTFQLISDPVSEPTVWYMIFLKKFLHKFLTLYSCLVNVLDCILWQDTKIFP